MKVIIGLGNIGEEYVNNRHNVGFHFIEFILGFLRPDKEVKQKFSIIYECRFRGQDILLVKPITQMNLAGLSVKEVVKLYNLKLSELLIVHDDLDIELGKYKLQIGKGPAGHNGVLDVEKKLKTKNFLRLRIGIENRKDKFVLGEEYVLNDFLKEEVIILNEIFKLAWNEILEKFILEWQRKGLTKI